MGRGKHVYVDEKLDNQIENFMAIGDFQTKAQASKKMGEMFEASLKSMRDTINEEIDQEIGLKEEEEKEDDGFFTDSGIDHSMLGFD